MSLSEHLEEASSSYINPERTVSLLFCVPGCFSPPASAQSALVLPCSKVRRDWCKKKQTQTHSCMTIMSLCRTDRISLSRLNDLLQGESVSGTWQCYYVTCDCAATAGLQLAFFILLPVDVQPAWGSTMLTVVHINEYFSKYYWMGSFCHILNKQACEVHPCRKRAGQNKTPLQVKQIL